MFSRHRRMTDVLYFLGDFILAVVSFALAGWLRASMKTPLPLYPLANYPWIVPLVLGDWMVVGLVAGAYRRTFDLDFRRAFTDPAKVMVTATTILFAIIFAFELQFISRLLLGFFAAIDLAAMVLTRLAALLLESRVRRRFGRYRNILLVGGTPEALDIARTIESNQGRGIRLFGFAVFDDSPRPDLSTLQGTHPVYSLPQVPELFKSHVIDEVIFAVAKDQLERLEETFLLCEEEGVKTRVLLTFFPHLISKVYLERLRDMPLLTFSTTPENEYLLFLKRVSDFIMALAFLILLSPLLIILALLVKITSPGSVFFCQKRSGLGGRKFTLIKFRSMYRDADKRKAEVAALNERDGPAFKIRNDPRCTPIGRLMRKFSLDELPQLINIVKGDMSFVGPRPPLPEEVEKYKRWQRRRLRMQPGLTCLWALEGRSELNFQRWMELDLEYIDNWSISLDWKILLKTIPVVLLGRGAS